jgi:hypothetical protein
VLLNDVLAKFEDHDTIGLDRVVCRYIFGTYANPAYPTFEEKRMSRDSNLKLRMESYPYDVPYTWADIERRVVASSGEWDSAILLSSNKEAFALARRIREDEIPGLQGKEAVVFYSHFSASTVDIHNDDYNSKSLERLFPAWNTILTSLLQPLSR